MTIIILYAINRRISITEMECAYGALWCVYGNVGQIGLTALRWRWIWSVGGILCTGQNRSSRRK